MSDQVIQLPPDSTGKLVDTSQLMVGSNTVLRQRMVLADPTAAEHFATIGADGALLVDINTGTIMLGSGAANLGTVAVSNLGNVTLATGGTVSIGNSGTVALTSGNSVAISGTPAVTGTMTLASGGTVAVSNIPAVTGTVSIGNEPTVMLDPTSVVGISGVPSVSIANTPTVFVSGGATTSSGASTLDSTSAISLTGAAGGDWDGVDILSTLLDDGSSVALGARVTNLPRQDQTGAQVASDAPVLYASTANALNVVLFNLDTTGFDCAAVQISGTFAATVQFQTSNDRVSWTSVVVIGTSGATQASGTTTATAAGMYAVPIVGRFLRAYLSAYTSGTVNAGVYLRSAPIPGITNTPNIVAFNGTAPVTAGVNGMLAVGGNIAAGTAPTGYPVLTGGIDTAGLTRRFLADTLGNTLVGGNVATGVAPTANPLPIAADTIGLTRRLLTDTTGELFTREPGGSPLDPNLSGVNEALNLIVLELRKLGFWMRRLVEVETGSGSVDTDDASLASDPTMFTN